MTDIKAAVVRTKGGPFQIEKLQLDDPREDEVLVRIVATGMCHSDLAVVHQDFPLPMPWLLGHEGAGIVEKVGAGVRHVAPGDPVVLSYDSCGHCTKCNDRHGAYCDHFAPLNIGGRRMDNSETLSAGVNGCFFYQSSFATYALAHARNTVKVSSEAPLELLGPLGCGIQTGAGAVLNVLKPSRGTSFALFGAGAVGLSALMGAKILGCDPIIAVDRVESRLDLARELGATLTIDASKDDAVARIAEAGGADLVVEATGVPTVAISAASATNPLGTCAMLGVYPPGKTIPVDLSALLLGGRKIFAITEGDADPQEFIPRLVQHYLAGELPIDKLVKFYTLDTINDAMRDSENGTTIKPIIRMT